MSPQLCIHAIIHGRVQGVFYRSWAASNARERGLSGWVRNRTDDTVEAVFCGRAGAVEDMLRACMEGPPSARVDNIIRQVWTGQVPAGFKKLDTA